MPERAIKTASGYTLNGWYILDLRHLNDSSGVRWTVVDSEGEWATYQDFYYLHEAKAWAAANEKAQDGSLACKHCGTATKVGA